METMHRLAASPALTVHLPNISDVYWHDMLEKVEKGACSRWASAARAQGPGRGVHSTVLWLTPYGRSPYVYLVTSASLGSGLQLAANACFRLDQGSVWSAVQDMYDGLPVELSSRDVDALVQINALGRVVHA